MPTLHWEGIPPGDGAPGAAEAGGSRLLHLHPNPCRDRARVSLAPPLRGGGTLCLFDAQGRLRLEVPVPPDPGGPKAIELDLRTLPSGVFGVRYAPAGDGPPVGAKMIRVVRSPRRSAGDPPLI